MKDSFHDYTYANARIEGLIGNWNAEAIKTLRRRKVRFVDISVSEWRETGKIQGDATYIPRRIADTNIRREQPPAYAYMTQSQDVAKFKPLFDIGKPSLAPLEQEFSKFAKYEGWALPLLKTWDGAATHGWDAVEVCFDASKPGHFSIYHIQHENLMFEGDINNLQMSPFCVITYYFTVIDLVINAEKYGFSAAVTEEVRQQLKSREGIAQGEKLAVNKLFFKDEDDTDEDGNPIVYVGWHCQKVSDWLLAPQRYHMGMGDEQSLVPLTEYPIYVLPYTVSENETIVETKGRVFLDENDQEACTQLVTAFVNRAIRASYILVAPETPNDDPHTKQTAIKLFDGASFPCPVKFFSVDPPDSAMLNGMNTIVSQNSNENGQVNFAVNNRKDSRKTATEVSAAQGQANMLNSVQVTLLSIWLSQVYTCCWRVVQGQVLQGKLQSALDDWETYYRGRYILLPAGDSDVVRRAETLQALKQDWPVFQNTAAAMLFLKLIIKLSPYAEYANELLAALEEGNHKDNLLQGMANALMTVANDPQAGMLVKQKYGPQLMELAGEYQRLMLPQRTVPGAAPTGEQTQAAPEGAEPPLPAGMMDNAPAAGGEQY